MKTAVIFAMQKEAERFIKSYADVMPTMINGIPFYEITDSLTVCVGGVGKVNTAISATILHERYSPDVIINAGVAGCLEDYPVGSVVVAPHCVQHDVDTTIAGDPIGLVSTVNVREFYTYNPDNTLKVLSESGIESEFGVVATGDWFGKDFDRARWVKNEFGALMCDMEAAAVCHVCLRYGTKPVIIKVVSDHVFSENQDEEYIAGVPLVSKTLTAATNMLVMHFLNESA